MKFFRRQIEKGIHSAKLFDKTDNILVALSGGKDSLSLILELQELGYTTTGVFIDLGIPQSSETAREHVAAFCSSHNIPLQVISLEKEGMPIPLVKKTLKRPICSVCGKIKRYWLNRAAVRGGFTALATGHNLDDEIGRLFSNVLRWDQPHLAAQGPLLPQENGFCRKVKPLWRVTEYETANYAFIKGIKPHWAPCPYSEGASFTTLKKIFHSLELAMPGRKLDFYQGFLERGKDFFQNLPAETPVNSCSQCGEPVFESNLCGICRIRQALSENDLLKNRE